MWHSECSNLDPFYWVNYIEFVFYDAAKAVQHGQAASFTQVYSHIVAVQDLSVKPRYNDIETTQEHIHSASNSYVPGFLQAIISLSQSF